MYECTYFWENIKKNILPQKLPELKFDLFPLNNITNTIYFKAVNT